MTGVSGDGEVQDNHPKWEVGDRRMLIGIECERPYVG